MYDKTKEIIEVIKEFLNIIENNDAIDEDSLRLILNRLELCCNYSKENNIFDDEIYPNAPVTESSGILSNIAKNFPDLGMYNIPNCISYNLASTEIIIGDATDDLLDIYMDLKETMWRFRNTSKEDALYKFNWSYKNHFGVHLKNLQWYLFHLEEERIRYINY